MTIDHNKEEQFDITLADGQIARCVHIEAALSEQRPSPGGKWRRYLSNGLIAYGIDGSVYWNAGTETSWEAV